MEQSNKINYNESITPSAPAINFGQQTHQGRFMHNLPAGAHPVYSQNGIQTQPDFVNSGFQPDFNQKPGFVPLPHQQITTFPPQQNSNETYCLNRNRRQIGSIAGGLFLMLISGLHIGWGIWRTNYLGLWAINLSISVFTFLLMAWSLGAFFGGFIGAALTPILKKNVIYYITASVMIIGNLLFIIWDGESEAIIVGRLLIGGAHGIAYVALIAHAGENAARNMRGSILSTINCMLYTGIFVSVLITGTVQSTWFGYTENISGERIVGIMGILFAVASIACTLTVTVETVPFLLHRNNRDQAMMNLKHLRDSSNETLELKQEMEELNLMVVQDEVNSCNIFTNKNGKPLVLMTMMRLMVALTNNLLINVIAIRFAFQMFYPFQYRLVPIAVVAPRLFMSIIQIFYADFFRRKTQIIVSSSLASFFLIFVGILENTLHISSSHHLYVFGIVFGVLWLTFQLTCSIGMDQMQDVYLSEAFSTAKKPLSISFVTGIEHLFHIFMIGMYFVGVNTLAHLSTLIFVSGGVVFLFGLILFFTLPETRRMSLKEAKDSFANWPMNLNIASPFA